MHHALPFRLLWERLLLGFGALCLAACSTQGVPADLFARASDATIEIELTPEHWAGLDQNARQYVPAVVRINDQVYSTVGLHLKGTRGSFQTLAGKPSFTLDFARFGRHPMLAGRAKLHLNNSAEDRSYLREQIGTELFTAAQLPAPRVGHALVKLNGRRLGLFVLKEGSDGFLRQHFGSAGGTFYEPLSGHDVDSPMQRHGGGATASEQPDRIRLAMAAGQPVLDDRWRSLGQVLNVDEFMGFMAMEVLLGHWDGYALARNNFRMARDRKTAQFIFLPWGMDQILVKPDLQWQPDTAGLVARAVLEVPAGREQYAAKFRDLYAKLFRPAQLTSQVRQRLAQIRPLLSEFEFEEVAREADALCGQMTARAASLEQQLRAPEIDTPCFEGNVATLDHWTPFDQSSASEMIETRDTAGQTVLRITAGPKTVASWRTSVRLPRGCYAFRGQVKAVSIAPLPFGRNQGAALRVLGRPARAAIQSGVDAWQSLTTEFEVKEPEAQIVLVCELRATEGEAIFAKDSLVLGLRSGETAPVLSRSP